MSNEYCGDTAKRAQREAKPRGATLAPTINGEGLALLQRLIVDKPDILLEELCEQLEQRMLAQSEQADNVSSRAALADAS